MYGFSEIAEKDCLTCSFVYIFFQAIKTGKTCISFYDGSETDLEKVGFFMRGGLVVKSQADMSVQTLRSAGGIQGSVESATGENVLEHKEKHQLSPG
ncbi:hypothetical protein [Pseudomonas syringae pv. coryli]|uniref:hypothetical protein n=1 Tax=Pseudomonas syringae pv. coryli TaxID=317659 RepID=UPI000A7EFB35|nr:hypothetical protein [Pseudomonas syringae pv. coryli]